MPSNLPEIKKPIVLSYAQLLEAFKQDALGAASASELTDPKERFMFKVAESVLQELTEYMEENSIFFVAETPDDGGHDA